MEMTTTEPNPNPRVDAARASFITPLELRSALRAARKERIPNQSVLDGLITALEPFFATGSIASEHERLGEMLRQVCGVGAVFDDRTSLPWPMHPKAAQLAQCGLVALREQASDLLRIGAADPWDADDASMAAHCIGTAVELVALPSDLLNRWLRLCKNALLATSPSPSDQGIASVVAPTPGMMGVLSTAPGLEEMDRLEQLEGYSFQESSNQEEEDRQPAEVVTFVNRALHSAFLAGASDVHFEYSRTGLTVKLRQDGVMTYHSSLTGAQKAEEVISRIKVLAQLDITERRIPQDGRFRFRFEAGNLDLRVSIMPSVFGEDAVLRLLDKAQLRANEAAVSLDLLGFDRQSVESIRLQSELPHGMMLITGPTGSGKTTTVYAILSEVNTGEEKIITIEDPVEYELSGVLQIPVNEKKGLTFARGLRSILRHDPDRILVGEIRDAETAEIAVQSALTGHQVFTTVHANSIFDVTGRFKHFGLDMFGFMSALNGVIVQRLVRRLCPHCLAHRDPTPRESSWLLKMHRPLTRVPYGLGCTLCRHTGYKGRLVIAEVHKVDDKLRDMVTLNAPVSQLRDHIIQAGVLSLGEQGARLIVDGMTTTDEVKRVVGWY